MASIIGSVSPHITRYLRLAAPVAADQIAYQLFCKARSPETAFFLVAPLAGAATMIRYCPKTDWKIAGGLYIAYKVVHWIINKSVMHKPEQGKFVVRRERRDEFVLSSQPAPSNPDGIPRAAARDKLIADDKPAAAAKSVPLRDSAVMNLEYLNFLKHFTITFTGDLGDKATSKGQEYAEAVKNHPNVKDRVPDLTAKWKSPEIVQEIDEWIGKAVQDMEMLYQQMETEAGGCSSDEAKYTEMAAQLMATENSMNDVEHSSKLNGRVASLPRIYRFIRARKILIQTLRSSISCNKVLAEQPNPFFTEGTPEWKWRDTYNQVIRKFKPVVEKLPDDSKIKNWMVEDTQEKPQEYDNPTNPFKLGG